MFESVCARSATRQKPSGCCLRSCVRLRHIVGEGHDASALSNFFEVHHLEMFSTPELVLSSSLAKPTRCPLHVDTLRLLLNEKRPCHLLLLDGETGRGQCTCSFKFNKKSLRVVQLGRASLAGGRQARMGPTSHSTCEESRGGTRVSTSEPRS